MEAGHPVLVGAQEAQQLGGEGEFGAVEGDEVDGRHRVPSVGAGQPLPYDAGLAVLLARRRQLREALDDQPRVHLEQLHRVGDQLLLGR
uniref:Uncharacterized protein n=1 Tax=Streptomyces avermitilis TaxID=33903 RepID=A0A499VG44_STRAX|nr:hypothetical protein SAVMC3_60940 [Streptomyces avermitilis]